MKKDSLFVPLFKTIDKVFFGIEDWDEPEKKAELCDNSHEEEFDGWEER